MRWTNEQQALIVKYRGTNAPSPTLLTRIPEGDRRYKCPVCHLVLSSADLIEGRCPVCGESAGLRIMSWHEEREPVMRQLVALGIEDLCTNDPAMTQRVIDAAGH